MARGRLAFVAQQGARHFRCQLDHLRALGDRLGKLELPRIDPPEIVDSSRSGRCPTVGGRSKRPQVDVVDPLLGEGVAERGLREAGPPRVRNGADVDDPLNARLLQGGEKFALGDALVTDGEDVHRL